MSYHRHNAARKTKRRVFIRTLWGRAICHALDSGLLKEPGNKPPGEGVFLVLRRSIPLTEALKLEPEQVFFWASTVNGMLLEHTTRAFKLATADRRIAQGGTYHFPVVDGYIPGVNAEQDRLAAEWERLTRAKVDADPDLSIKARQ